MRGYSSNSCIIMIATYKFWLVRSGIQEQSESASDTRTEYDSWCILKEDRNRIEV
jgi:hypothetical protein